MRRWFYCGLFLAWGLWGEGAPAPSPVSFSRVPIRGELVTYFDSAVWAPGEELLLVNHPRAGQLVPLRRDGQLAKPLEPFPRNEADPAFAYAMGTDAEGPFVVYCTAWMSMARELRFTPAGGISRIESWEGRVDPSQAKLVCPVKRLVRFAGEIFTFAVVRENETKIRSGLLRFQASPGAKFTFLREFSTNTVEATMAWSYPTLAATGQGVFYLDFSTDPPRVLQLAPTSRSLASFPPGFQAPPATPANLMGPDGAEAFETGLEATPVPVGLFTLDEHLVILTRTPRPQGQAFWELHLLDPTADRLGGVIALPTAAPKVLVVPGSKRWAVLELGPSGPPFGVRKLLGLWETSTESLRAFWRNAHAQNSKPTANKR